MMINETHVAQRTPSIEFGLTAKCVSTPPFLLSLPHGSILECTITGLASLFHSLASLEIASSTGATLLVSTRHWDHDSLVFRIYVFACVDLVE